MKKTRKVIWIQMTAVSARDLSYEAQTWKKRWCVHLHSLLQPLPIHFPATPRHSKYTSQPFEIISNATPRHFKSTSQPFEIISNAQNTQKQQLAFQTPLEAVLQWRAVAFLKSPSVPQVTLLPLPATSTCLFLCCLVENNFPVVLLLLKMICYLINSVYN